MKPKKVDKNKRNTIIFSCVIGTMLLIALILLLVGGALSGWNLKEMFTSSFAGVCYLFTFFGLILFIFYIGFKKTKIR